MSAPHACPHRLPQGRASLVAFTVDGCDVMQLAADLDKIHHIAVRCDQAQHQFS